jgi:hypothetical protein
VDNPQALVFDLIYGRWRSQILYAGVKLGIFDFLIGESKLASAIAQELGLDSGLLYRLLRALASLGLLIESPDQCFSLSAAGEILRSDHPQTMGGLALLVEGPEHYAIWKHLPAIVHDGIQNGFVREFGHTAFKYAEIESAYGKAFDAGMSGHSRQQTTWVLDALQAYDFSQIKSLCDVGGGQGYLISHFLVKYAHLKGFVLERASVIENRQALWAEKLNVSDRCQYVAGNMFFDVPAADAYLLKPILHDWNDEECIQILQVIQRRASPAGRVFVAEHVIPDSATPHFSKLFDIHMMCWGNGRERTFEEYATLFDKSGWRFVKFWRPSQGTVSVIEAEKL